MLSKEAIIQKTMEALNALPQEKAEEICTFAEFILKRYEDQGSQKGSTKAASGPREFNLSDEDRELQLE